MNQNGEVVQRYHFGEFGNVEASKGTSENDYLFTGKEQDNSGLYYFMARFYNPQTGRFITPDPFPGYRQIPQSQHPYAYCYNDPVNYIDPWGLDYYYIDDETKKVLSSPVPWTIVVGLRPTLEIPYPDAIDIQFWLVWTAGAKNYKEALE